MNNVLIIYDNLDFDNEFVRDRLEDLTNFYYNRPDWRLITTRNLDGMLQKVANTNAAEYVIVNALGHYFRHGDHNEMVKLAQSTNSPLVGHLLARHDYYSIDPQYFCINMAAYRAAGMPSLDQINQPETFTSIAVERSVENFHDDYTPHWIRPGSGNAEYNVKFREFGSVLVQKFLEAGYTLQNIPQDMRNRKHYLYPNTYTREIELFFRDYTYQTDTVPLKGYFDAIRRYFEDERRSIYILSTEPVPTKTARPNIDNSDFQSVEIGRIDTYVGVCGALKTIPILFKNGFDANTRVNLIDISQAALGYQQYLRENWDGDLDNYEEVFNKFRNQWPLDYIYCWKSWNTWNDEMSHFIIGSQMTRSEFKTAWDTYLKCDVKFHEVNLLDADALTKFIGEVGYQGTSYTWVSNAYNMEHTTAALGSEYMSSQYLHLLRLLKAQPGRVFIEQNNLVELLAGPRQG
jgi:hypothetical protein